MKSIYILSIFLGTSFSLFSQQTIDEIAAQVGDNIILLSDIQGQKLQMIQAGMTVNDQTDCGILEELMYQNLLINQAKLDSIEISDEQVDADMENRLRMIEQQIGSRQKMEEFYGKTVGQIKAEFRPIIKEQMLAQEMERLISADMSITPREVENFYKSIPVDSIPLINSQLSFQQIVIYPEINATDKERAYNQLEEIRKNIVENGKTFSTQARIHSMDPGSAGKGGEIQASKGMMVPPFEAAVFSLKKGEVSNVFESEYGFHIVKLIERRGDDYTCQHILITPEFSPTALENAALKMDTCYNRIQSGEITWEQAVLKYSNDESTKQNKGIITNPITGEQKWDMEDLNQVDQQIYLLTNSLEVGDVSEPNLYTNMMERKQGVRIVRLMDRTEPHRANLKQDYSLITKAAENDKKQKLVSEWVQSKIQNTYITIKEPYNQCDFVNPWVK